MKQTVGRTRFSVCYWAVAGLLLTVPELVMADQHFGEVVAGQSLFGGAKVGIAWQRTFSGPLALTVNAEWAETPFKVVGETVYRDRFAYVGVGTRWRFRRETNLRPFLGVGIGLGRLSYPFVRDGWPTFEAGRREFTWLGFGFDAQVGRRLRLVCESRIEVVDEGQGSVRLGVQVPVGSKKRE